MVDVRVLHGDCVELMRGMPDNSVDSIVTDPPYELGFMGKQWDGTGIAYDVAMWGEVLRVLKPGGHLLAFGGTRTFHRMTVAIEDAGFEIRDCLSWLYGSGFPKSHNVGKNVDKHLKAEPVPTGDIRKGGWRPGGNGGNLMNNAGGGLPDIVETAPATEEARRWEGWGTALKPAWEPIVMARKPFKSTVAQNVLEWGTGALNIDGSRIGTSAEDFAKLSAGVDAIIKRGGTMENSWKNSSDLSGANPASALGRWPANVMFDEAAAALLDEQTGNVGNNWKRNYGSEDYAGRQYAGGSFGGGGYGTANTYADSGGASRFFYVAKASRRDRNEGLDGLEPKREADRVRDDGVGGDNLRNISNAAKLNHHPTVKPTALMRYLVKLVTPPDGTVLDPFAGSGTTLVAAVLEGFNAIGCEMTDEYLPIIEGRVEWARQETVRRAQETAPTLFDGN